MSTAGTGTVAMNDGAGAGAGTLGSSSSRPAGATGGAPRASFAREAAISLGTQVVTQLLAFATSFVMLRILPPSVKGPAELVTALPTYLIVFGNLGLQTAMVYARRDRSLDDVASTVLTVGLVVGSLTAGIAALVLPGYFASHRVVIDPWHVALILAIAPLQLSTSYLNTTQLLAGRILGFNLVQLLPIVVFIAAFFGVYLSFGKDYFEGHGERFLSALVWSNVAKWVVASIVAVALVRRLATFRPMIDWAYLKSSLAFGLRPYVRDVFQVMTLFSMPYLLNSLRFSDEELGWYSMALTGQIVIWQVPEALQMVFANRVAGLVGSDRKRFTPAVCRNVLFTTIVAAVGITLCAELIVPAWAPKYVPALATLQILLGGSVVFTLFKVLQADLLARGEKNRIAAYSASAFFLLAGLTLLVVKGLGLRSIEAAAACSSAALATVGIAVLLHYVRVSGNPISSIVFLQKEDVAAWKGWFRSALGRRA